MVKHKEIGLCPQLFDKKEGVVCGILNFVSVLVYISPLSHCLATGSDVSAYCWLGESP